ncbi:cell division protein FtsL [Wenzhouxiangella sp. EGI_FJ10305]|uniref:cell division protein FtsL n=1 Tax=Wenzhouxiangella sp. EGI_FJ10305 TaxID=3243768 RepID=UPI0035D915C8
MIRWLLLLLLTAAVMASAIGVVVLRHESRQLFVALQEAETERDAARMEWSRLQLEQAWLGDAGRVEGQARDELGMKSPEDVRILVTSP